MKMENGHFVAFSRHTWNPIQKVIYFVYRVIHKHKPCGQLTKILKIVFIEAIRSYDFDVIPKGYALFKKEHQKTPKKPRENLKRSNVFNLLASDLKPFKLVRLYIYDWQLGQMTLFMKSPYSSSTRKNSPQYKTES